MGFFVRRAAPHRIQRYRCSRCRRSFSAQTFSPTYWLRRPDVLPVLFGRLVACSGYRQIARELAVSPTTVLGQTARLGRHCLLFHERLRPRHVTEPLAVDGFESFEFSQYTPVHFHLAVGAASHFLYGFTDSELRRKGRMTAVQKERRAALEAAFGRPDPRSIEREMAALLEICCAMMDRTSTSKWFGLWRSVQGPMSLMSFLSTASRRDRWRRARA